MARVRKAKQIMEMSVGEVRIIDMDFGPDMLAGTTVTGVTSVTITPSASLTQLNAFSGTKAQLTLTAVAVGTVVVVVRVATSNSETLEGSMDVVIDTA